MRVKVDAELTAQIGVGEGQGPRFNFEETLNLIRALVAEAKALT